MKRSGSLPLRSFVKLAVVKRKRAGAGKIRSFEGGGRALGPNGRARARTSGRIVNAGLVSTHSSTAGASGGDVATLCSGCLRGVSSRSPTSAPSRHPVCTRTLRKRPPCLPPPHQGPSSIVGALRSAASTTTTPPDDPFEHSNQLANCPAWPTLRRSRTSGARSRTEMASASAGTRFPARAW